jgi:hypothetical protein
MVLVAWSMSREVWKIIRGGASDMSDIISLPAVIPSNVNPLGVVPFSGCGLVHSPYALPFFSAIAASLPLGKPLLMRYDRELYGRKVGQIRAHQYMVNDSLSYSPTACVAAIVDAAGAVVEVCIVMSHVGAGAAVYAQTRISGFVPWSAWRGQGDIAAMIQRLRAIGSVDASLRVRMDLMPTVFKLRGAKNAVFQNKLKARNELAEATKAANRMAAERLKATVMAKPGAVAAYASWQINTEAWRVRAQARFNQASAAAAAVGL